jgi:hypothetical protein
MTTQAVTDAIWRDEIKLDHTGWLLTARHDAANVAASPMDDDLSNIGFEKFVKLKAETDGETLEPYDPTIAFVERKLPESIFSSVIMMPLILRRNKCFDRHLFVYLLPQAVCYSVAVFLQVMFLFYFWKIVEEAERCTVRDVMLRIICLAVFAAKTLSDVSETVFMFRFVWNIPRWNEARDTPKLNLVTVRGLGSTSFPHQEYMHRSAKYNERLVKPAAGIALWRKILSMLLVLLPKFGITISLLAIGGGHILASKDKESMILSTLASVFIFEVDDIIYKLMIPPAQRWWLEWAARYTELPFNIASLEVRWLFPIYFVSWVIAVFSLYSGWCGLGG